MEAYAGGIEAYIKTGDEDALQAFYDQAVMAAGRAEEEILHQNMDYVTEIYLSADEVYSNAPEKAAEILEEGWDITQSSEIKNRMMEIYFFIVGGEGRVREYGEVLDTYDRLLELAQDSEDILVSVKKYVIDYLDFLIGENRYDEVKAAARKYEDVILIGDNWVDNLYCKMLMEDADAVFAIMSESDFMEKCKAFTESRFSNELSYKLETSGGQIVWVTTHAAAYGKYMCMHFPRKNKLNYEATWAYEDYGYCLDTRYYDERAWYIGTTVYHPDGSTYEVFEGSEDGKSWPPIIIMG